MWKKMTTPFAAALLMLAAAGALATDASGPPPDAHKLSSGLSSVAQLLQLMDTDKNGKVSKEEFMHFMEAEFDYADKNKDNELDPNELRHFVHNLTQPRNGPGR
jgi:hypothetical protein